METLPLITTDLEQWTSRTDSEQWTEINPRMMRELPLLEANDPSFTEARVEVLIYIGNILFILIFIVATTQGT